MAETDPVYGDSWYAASMAAVPARPCLTHDLDVDVCVIGAGLAGLTTAREIARGGWSVAVLEAKRIAWNASGRNCGFVLPGFAEDIRRIVGRVGLDHAKALWALSEAGVEYVRSAIHETGMAGVDPVPGWLDVSKVDNGDELLSIVSLLGQEFGAEIEGWPTERVRAALKTRHYFHAMYFPTAFHIQPLNYAHGLARAAENAGVRIFEDTPALAIDPAGVRKRVVTPAARIRAAHVVLAGNTHLAGLMPEIAGTLLPITSFVAVTAPLGSRLDQAISFRGAVSDTLWADYHYRIVDGDRLQWAGGIATWNGHPRRWTRRFERAIERIYPQLGPVEFAYTWSGQLGAPLHKMPQIGEVSSGLWLASGFAGHGLNTTAMAGELIARAILDGDDTWRMFAPFDLVWAGGALGRVAAQAIYWSARVSEEVTARLARDREEATERAAVISSSPAEATQATPDMSALVVDGIAAVDAHIAASPLAVHAPAIVATAERADPHPTAQVPAPEPAQQAPPVPESHLPASPDAAPAGRAGNVIVVAVGPPSKPRPQGGRISAGVRKTKRRKAVGPDGVA